jgi:hypothetical protein
MNISATATLAGGSSVQAAPTANLVAAASLAGSGSLRFVGWAKRSKTTIAAPGAQTRVGPPRPMCAPLPNLKPAC